MGTIEEVGDGRVGWKSGTCYENIITAAQGAILFGTQTLVPIRFLNSNSNSSTLTWSRSSVNHILRESETRASVPGPPQSHQSDRLCWGSRNPWLGSSDPLLEVWTLWTRTSYVQSKKIKTSVKNDCWSQRTDNPLILYLATQKFPSKRYWKLLISYGESKILLLYCKWCSWKHDELTLVVWQWFPSFRNAPNKV